MLVKKQYKISGMNCASCSKMIEIGLEGQGVKAQVNYPKELLDVEFDNSKIKEEEIKDLVEKGGYQLS